MFSYFFDLFQHHSCIGTLVGNNIIRISNYAWKIQLKPFIIVWMSLPDMRNAFLCYDYFIGRNLFHNTLVLPYIQLPQFMQSCFPVLRCI